MRIAINGYGRIGQSVLRAIFERGLHHEWDVVALNSLTDLETAAYLTRYDSVHGRFPFPVEITDKCLKIDGQNILYSECENPADLSWQDIDIDLLFECSGSFSDRQMAEEYLKAGSKRIMLSHPATSDIDATVVYGINHHHLSGKENYITAAACTTNCVAPVIDLIERRWGIINGTVTTLHSAMNDQSMGDHSRPGSLRLKRAGLGSIIPIETSLAKGISRIFPHLEDRFECSHIRVPTLNVSALDLTINLKSETTTKEVNQAFAQEADENFDGILVYTDEPQASVDFNHLPHSCIFDATQTKVSLGKTVRLLCWFDNEWGYANRMIDIARFIEI